LRRAGRRPLRPRLRPRQPRRGRPDRDRARPAVRRVDLRPHRPAGGHVTTRISGRLQVQPPGPGPGRGRRSRLCAADGHLRRRSAPPLSRPRGRGGPGLDRRAEADGGSARPDGRRSRKCALICAGFAPTSVAERRRCRRRATIKCAQTASRRAASDSALKETKMATVKVTDDSFDADVLKSSTPVLVDFWAEWCGPCKQIGPALEQISDELAGKVTIAKVNIDDSPMVPSKMGVKGIPTLMLFKDGQMTSMKVGAMPKGKIVEWLAEAGVKAD